MTSTMPEMAQIQTSNLVDLQADASHQMRIWAWARAIGVEESIDFCLNGSRWGKRPRLVTHVLALASTLMSHILT
jgi:hypothetical protein